MKPDYLQNSQPFENRRRAVNHKHFHLFHFFSEAQFSKIFLLHHWITYNSNLSTEITLDESNLNPNCNTPLPILHSSMWTFIKTELQIRVTEYLLVHDLCHLGVESCSVNTQFKERMYISEGDVPWAALKQPCVSSEHVCAINAAGMSSSKSPNHNIMFLQKWRL